MDLKNTISHNATPLPFTNMLSLRKYQNKLIMICIKLENGLKNNKETFLKSLKYFPYKVERN